MASTPLVVAFQGEPGAYSEQAALELLGSDNSKIATRGYDSFDKCFKAVQSGEAYFAMLPIENSLGGTIHANYDLQLRHDFFIVAEHDFRVRHCLMAHPGVKEADISKVLSHPQALAQCDGYLRSRNLDGEAAYDTAGSAKLISENREGNLSQCAAIASALAAERYGLEILDAGIEDDDNNFTRFILLSRRWLPLDRDAPRAAWKTTMVFSLVNNQPGVLVKALSAFSFRDIDMTKLESRPDKLQLKGRQIVVPGATDDQQIPTQDRELLERLKFPDVMEPSDSPGGEYSGASPAGADASRFKFVFYLDCVGSLADRNLQNALRHLSELATFFRILGSYPKGGVLCDYVANIAGGAHGSTLATSKANAAAAGNVGVPRPLQYGPASGTNRKLKIGILGFGNFGQFLAKTFTKYHDVFACSRTDYNAVAAELGVRFTADIEAMCEQAHGLDVLVISVSILSFESVLRKLPMDLLKGVLVVDVLSVKTLPKNALQIFLPDTADILCTHPMFGPESGKFSWRGLPCVYEKVRINSSQLAEADLRCERFLDIFRLAGCRMVEMSCETHDQAAAGSQFVTHFTGRLLSQLNLRPTPISTKGFETLLTLVDNTCKDSFDLFQALYQCNPNSSSQLQALQQAMVSITSQLQARSQDKAEEGIRFSDFVGRIQPSKTSETHARALELKRQGKDIVTTLTVGEPDFAPPEPIMRSLATAPTSYTPVGGVFELKQAIADDYARRKGVQYDAAKDILITHGGKQAIFLAVLALCQFGDEVVIPAPYWVSYPDIVRLSGADPVIVDCDPRKGYVMSPEQLTAALTPKTRMIIMCNPSNPTGGAYTTDELEQIAQVLRRPEYAHVLVLSDEIYERLTYDNFEHTSFAALPGMKERTLLVHGFAKAYAMTGFRLGYLACPQQPIIAAALKLQSQVNSCASSVSQHAGIAALREVPEEMLAPLYKGLEDKRNAIVSALREMPHVVCPVPKGAFYVFPDVSYYLGKNAKSAKSGRVVNTSTDLCNYLIEEHGLALPPGDAFGGPTGVRFSYATSMEDILRAVERFRAGLEGLELGQ